MSDVRDSNCVCMGVRFCVIWLWFECILVRIVFLGVCFVFFLLGS